ncbi:hypothetical protein AB0L40_24130, partial [Patulibacter sp. NPDC049589]|uniref:hypothetical protein n=1 Tax=Patulibacter sp. NPDC049589 TaxID=3154731 RepID=UPI00342A02B3
MPLTVHRRCDEPMFGFVNALAYDGLMVHATGAGPGDAFRSRYSTLPPSKWIDVVAAEAEGHWIPGEGEQLDRILDTLRDVGVDPPARCVRLRPYPHPVTPTAFDFDLALDVVEEEVGARAYDRGRRYASGGRVLSLSWRADDEVFEAKVVGSGRIYETELYVFTGRDGRMHYD